MLSCCLAIRDVSAKSCTMNTYKKWWGVEASNPESLHADDCALGWKSRQGRQKLAQGGSRGSVRVRDIPNPGQGRHRVGSMSSEEVFGEPPTRQRGHSGLSRHLAHRAPK